MIEWDKIQERVDIIERIRALFIAGRISQAEIEAIELKAKEEIASLLSEAQ